MSSELIRSSLWHYRRVQLATVAGVAVATAVVIGALLVGDSLRGSLRALTLERLGRIETVLVAEHPFREEMSEGVALLMGRGTLVAESRGRGRHGSLQRARSSKFTRRGGSRAAQTHRATQLTLLGHRPNFWQLDKVSSPPSPAPLQPNEIAIAPSIAAELGVQVGDEVLLRVPLLKSIPADSTLGEKVETTAARRLRIGAILPKRGLANFALRPSQHPARNVFVPLAVLQNLMQLEGRVNALAFTTSQPSLRPQLKDFGLQCKAIQLDNSPASPFLQITADRLVLPPHVVDVVEQCFQDSQPVITYLANTISLGDRKIPYSTITGVNSTAALGPLLDANQEPLLLEDDQIILNDWAADDLQAKVGDVVRITFYEPETTHGVLREYHPPLKLRLRAIVPLANGDDDNASRATRASDPHLTPELPGVTDQASIHDWELPFELVENIRSNDEQYWDDHSTTPKAFVSLALARRLWKTRWGSTSILRLPPVEGRDVDSVAKQLEEKLDPAQLGMRLLPVKQQGLQASSGTTPFDGLFLGFSFFLFAAAVLLVAILVRLSWESRAAEVGLLAAVGWTPGRLRRLLMTETAIVALVGAIAGVAAGVGYARLLVHGLNTWWIEATVTPFLSLHVSPLSLLIGGTTGFLVALFTVFVTLRKFVRLPVRKLLSGDTQDFGDTSSTQGAVGRWIPRLAIAAAIALAIAAFRWEGEARAGAFFGSGTLVLIGLLCGLRNWLRQPQQHVATGLSLWGFSLWGLSLRNARRNPSRTLLSVGLTAMASFLIVALSAFRLAPSEQGTGGFDLLATTDAPLHLDLNTSTGRSELGFGSKTEALLAGIEVHAFRLRAGEDASCQNLYQTLQPQVLGLPESFEKENRFAWAGHLPLSETDATPWSLLNVNLEHNEKTIPVVLDKSTALYSLHLKGVGSQFSIRDALDRPIQLKVVGLLANSILQGKVLMSESHFLQLFPEVQGQQFFLIRNDAAPLSTSELATLLETQLEDYGLDAIDARDRLAGFLAVQNTYLSTFQSLGALGLLLGTVGLAVVQLRNLAERRGELALMRSAGFRHSRLARLVLSENLAMLLGGLGIGCLAALVAVLPHALLQQAAAPWATLAALLLTIAASGIVVGWLATRSALRAPLLPALRGD